MLDPHHFFITPAYIVTALVFAGLTLRALLMLRSAARRAKDEETRA